MSNEAIARRYASALADVTIKDGDSEAVKTELKQWEVLMTANAEFQAVFGNPAVAHSKKEAILEQLLQRAKLSKTAANFLRVLLQNGRLGDLQEINERYAAVLEERSGIVSGEVISAHELASDHRTALTSNLEKLTGRRVKLSFEIDPDLIGGVVTRVGSTVYDASVRTQLENLREQLVNG